MVRLLSISLLTLSMTAPVWAQDPGDRFKISPPPAKVVEPTGATLFDLTDLYSAHPDAKAKIDRISIDGAQLRRSGPYLLVMGPPSAAVTVAEQLNALRQDDLATQTVGPIAPSSIYTKVRKTRDGIGKAFMGREIAQVMGHLGAGWLERPEREQEERTDLLVGMLPLTETTRIADIGAGSGYFTSRLSPRVPRGKVLATDIQPEMLEILSRRIREEGLTNVQTVLGRIDDTGLEPSSVDLILLVDVYHEFDHPWEMLVSMRNALKPNGLVAIAEYRANDPMVPIKPLHTMSAEQVILEFELAGFTLEDVKTDLPWQRLFLFGRDDRPEPSRP